MSFRYGWVAIVAAALVSSGILAPAASASAPAVDLAISPRIDNGTWALTGTLTAPLRSSASTVTVSLSGSIEVTQGVLDLAACDDTVNNAAQALPQLRNTGTSSFTEFGSSVTPISGAGSVAVSGSVSVTPASYELVVRYRCGASGSWRGQVSATPPITVRTATLTSTQNLTLACLATQGTCPSAASVALGVPSGYSIRFGAVTRFTWSDGAVTEEVPAGTQRLESSSSGSFWSTVANSCATTVTISSTLRYRCVVGSTNFTDIQVSRVEPTSTYEFGAPQLNPSAGLSGVTSTITASLLRQFSDGSKWPAATGTSFTLEFQSLGGFSWSQLGSSRSTTIEGTISTTFTITESGSVRLRIGSLTSTPTEVILLARTGKYQVSGLSGPALATPGTSVTISGRVQEELSNTTLAPPNNGVSLDLEFAIAYSASATDLTWTKLASGSTSNGTVSATATAQYSGLYRFRKDDHVSQPVFVPVTGSAPITVTGSITPVSTEVPFVGTATRFSVSAQLSGYVGTDTLALEARVGDTVWIYVGSITSSSKILGVYSLPNPTQWGESATGFRVVDQQRQLVVGSGSGASVFVDGIKAYRPKLAAPSRLYLPGETVRFSATLAAVTHLDRELPATWSGSASLQRSDGAVWRPVRVVMSTRGNAVTMETEAVVGATYRVESSFAATASEPIAVEVSRGAPKLEVDWPDTVKVSQGLRVSAFVQLSEGQRWAGTSPVQLQFRAPNTTRWIVKARKIMSDGRNVSMTAARPTAGCYRVIIPAYGIEDYAGYGVKSCTADPSA